MPLYTPDILVLNLNKRKQGIQLFDIRKGTLTEKDIMHYGFLIWKQDDVS